MCASTQHVSQQTAANATGTDVVLSGCIWGIGIHLQLHQLANHGVK